MTTPSPSGFLGSPLGNIALGWTDFAPASGSGTTGHQVDSLGGLYDFALGYDPGTGMAKMVGYVVAQGERWVETANLQEVQSLREVASPNFTDRDLTYWPKVSQGTWAGGERQLISEKHASSFQVVKEDRYYQSQGIDVGQAGRLQLLPGLEAGVTFSETHAGSFPSGPLATDGLAIYFGVTNAGASTNLIIFDGVTFSPYGIGATHGEIFDIVNTPLGVFVGCVDGIFQVSPNGGATQWTNDVIFQRPGKSLAYFDNKLFYITKTVHNMDRISYVQTVMGAAPGIAAFTNGSSPEEFEASFDCLGASATGLVLSTNVNTHWTTPPASANGSTMSVIYVSDGNSLVRIADVNGRVLSIYEMNGITYLLSFLFQPLEDHLDYTLYSLNDTTMEILDDLRYGLLDFQTRTTELANYIQGTSIFFGHLYGDGRFLYLGWPGQPGLRYDSVVGGIQTVTPQVSNEVASHRLVILNGVGLAEATVRVMGGSTTTTVKIYPLAPPAKGATGQLISSYYDFNTPAHQKFFRTFELELAEALTAGASIGVEFEIDGTTSWTSLSVQNVTTQSMVAYFPAGTKGKRVRYRLTFVQGTTAGPIVAAYHTKANLGRVFKTVVSCKRNLLLRNGQEDQQGLKGKDLIAHIQKAYDNAGKVTLFVPSPKSDTGWERVEATLENYEWQSVKGSIDPGDNGQYDMEGNCQLELVEL